MHVGRGREQEKSDCWQRVFDTERVLQPFQVLKVANGIDQVFCILIILNNVHERFELCGNTGDDFLKLKSELPKAYKKLDSEKSELEAGFGIHHFAKRCERELQAKLKANGSPKAVAARCSGVAANFL